MQKIKAAVLRGPKQLNVETIEIDEPKEHEVLVDVYATGVCATDYHRYTGSQKVLLPIVLGHEGAGVVEAVGNQVTMVKPGDHVVLAANLYCGKCPACISGQPALCSKGPKTAFGGTQMDGTTRLHSGTEKINQFFAQSSFATKAVVPELAAIKVRDDASFDSICLLACCASTGIGAVLNTANVKAGESVAIFGCGGLGASAILATNAISAGKIIGVDIVQGKLDNVKPLGATHTINASKENPIERIKEITGGSGVDYALEFTGNTQVMEQAAGAVRPGGATIISGSPGPGSKFVVDCMSLVSGAKKIIGNRQGSSCPAVDIPRYVEMYMKGDLNLDALVTNRYKLDEIVEAFNAMEKGGTIRSIIKFEH